MQCLVDDVLRHLQRASVSDPREVAFVEEVGVWIVIKSNGGEASREASVLVLGHIWNDGYSGRHLVDGSVRKREAHGLGSDVAGSAFCLRAGWKSS